MKKWVSITLFTIGIASLTAAIVVPIVVAQLDKKLHHKPYYCLNSNDVYINNTQGFNVAKLECLNSDTNSKSVKIFNGSNEDVTSSFQISTNSSNSYFTISHDSLDVASEEKFNVELLDSSNHNILSGNNNLYVHSSSDNNSLSSIEQEISSLSFSFRLTKTPISSVGGSGTGTTAVTGTCFPIKKVDGQEHTYDFLTNWHIKTESEQLGKGETPYFYFGENISSNSVTKYVQFSSCNWINHGTFSSLTSNNSIGSDCELFEATFPDPSSDSWLTNKLNTIDSILPTLFATDVVSSNWKADEYYIGGFPNVDTSNKNFEFNFKPVRINVVNGYNNKDWNAPKEGETISHFMDTKNNWSINNDILFNPTSCDIFQGGASGSMVLDKNGKLFGIYWGGRVNDENQAYSGNIEPLVSINDDIDHFISNTSLDSLFPGFSFS